MTCDLTTGKYKSYNKPGNIPLYINVKSNHPPNIIRNLPDSISRRINKLLSDKNMFENSKDIYNNALTVVSNRKSNLIQILAITTAKIRIENETSYGSILPTVITF